MAHPHSAIALKARYDYRELSDIRGLDSLYFTAVASLYSHHKADVQAGSKRVSELFMLALGRIPYYNVGRTESREESLARSVRKMRILNRYVTADVVKADEAYRESRKNESEGS